MVPVAQLKDVPASPSLRPDIAELRSRVAQIAPQIKARAHTTEKAGRVPEENIIALRNIGYFDIVKPAMFGGYEHDFDVLVELNIELAKNCASTESPTKSSGSSSIRFRTGTTISTNTSTFPIAR